MLHAATRSTRRTRAGSSFGWKRKKRYDLPEIALHDLRVIFLARSAPASFQGMGVVFPRLARFHTILIDTARYRSESSRFEYETARYSYENIRLLRAFSRYLIWRPLLPDSDIGHHVALIVQFRAEIAAFRMRIVENRTRIVRFRATIVRNRTGSYEIVWVAKCAPCAGGALAPYGARQRASRAVRAGRRTGRLLYGRVLQLLKQFANCYDGCFNPPSLTMYRHCLALLASLAISAGALAADSHGFRIEDPDNALSTDARASLDEQLQIVESVGLPAPVLEALRRTPIVVDPGLRGQPGVFMVQGGQGVVRVRPIVFPANKPILLHEFLHAYDYKVLGMADERVTAAYRQVKDSSLFPPQFQASHFLANAKEFFAVSGTLYLFGDIQQPPFRCQALEKLGPDYLAFLASQFGPHSCHEGRASAG